MNRLDRMLREFGLNPVNRGSVEKIMRGERINPFAGLTE